MGIFGRSADVGGTSLETTGYVGELEQLAFQELEDHINIYQAEVGTQSSVTLANHEFEFPSYSGTSATPSPSPNPWARLRRLFGLSDIVSLDIDLFRRCRTIDECQAAIPNRGVFVPVHGFIDGLQERLQQAPADGQSLCQCLSPAGFPQCQQFAMLTEIVTKIQSVICSGGVGSAPQTPQTPQTSGIWVRAGLVDIDSDSSGAGAAEPSRG